MPIYDYKCPACDTDFEKTVRMANYLDPQECPKCQTMSDRTVKGAPSLGDPMRLGLQKPDNAFRDVLRNIHERTPGSQLKNNSSYI
jgi:putative FmdB family regulatory protein